MLLFADSEASSELPAVAFREEDRLQEHLLSSSLSVDFLKGSVALLLVADSEASSALPAVASRKEDRLQERLLSLSLRGDFVKASGALLISVDLEASLALSAIFMNFGSAADISCEEDRLRDRLLELRVSSQEVPNQYKDRRLEFSSEESLSDLLALSE